MGYTWKKDTSSDSPGCQKGASDSNVWFQGDFNKAYDSGYQVVCAADARSGVH